MGAIFDGRALADSIYRQLLERRAHIDRPIRLGILVCDPDLATESFVRIKTKRAEALGVILERIDAPKGSRTEDLVVAVKRLATSTDGVVVQLPLPQAIDTDEVVGAIPRHKDVDALSPLFSEEERMVRAPVALAIREILKSAGIDSKGKRAAVIGRGRLVGAPVTRMLEGEGAEVSSITLEEGSMDDLKHADIIVSGAGSPGLIKAGHLKVGAVLIDAGTAEQAGVIAGDADPRCIEVVSLLTPIPGGVGPVAVAMLFQNLFDLVGKTG
jgi:methylenetetrahydrofolate dehydrogenase (NADP+)/methenyltetrahydrofolate cyclohydrolase